MERRRYAAFRIAERSLSGPAIHYGMVTAVRDADGRTREMIAPGAFGEEIPAVALDLEHDPDLIIVEAGRLALEDSPERLHVRADLPETSAAIKLVQAGRLRGFSVAFRDREVERRDGVDVVRRADLIAISLVGEPAYRDSLARVRSGPRRIAVPAFLL